VGEAIATELYQEGYRSIADVAAANLAELANVEGLNEKDAAQLIATAKEYLQDAGADITEAKPESVKKDSDSVDE
jgi:transcription termination factor NusA